LKNARPTPTETSRRVRRELTGRGETGGIAAQLGERALQRLDLERGDIDQARAGAGHAFERREQVVDGLE
jgi:hypothetical protein